MNGQIGSQPVVLSAQSAVQFLTIKSIDTFNGHKNTECALTTNWHKMQTKKCNDFTVNFRALKTRNNVVPNGLRFCCFDAQITEKEPVHFPQNAN